jgi:hypothetical protein
MVCASTSFLVDLSFCVDVHSGRHVGESDKEADQEAVSMNSKRYGRCDNTDSSQGEQEQSTSKASICAKTSEKRGTVGQNIDGKLYNRRASCTCFFFHYLIPMRVKKGLLQTTKRFRRKTPRRPEQNPQTLFSTHLILRLTTTNKPISSF